jgi:hypothetical protein
MKLKQELKTLINRLPYISGLFSENQLFRKNACYPPGHYYSPIVSVDEIRTARETIWGNDEKILHGIDLRKSEQVSLLVEFEKYYNEIPFSEVKDNGLRYYFRNSYYSFSDGIILYSFIRHFRPKRIIEAGSGFSSALMLDENEIFFNNSISLKFIEPYPERLKSLMKIQDKENCEIIQKRIQDVPVNNFRELNEDDILFIDSSHVCKTGSDVNYLLFDVIPILKKGVIIHFHDIFYPFEYPEEWVMGGRNWNEIYLVKAFLMNNKFFEILFFSHYIHLNFPETFKNMPLAYKDWGCNFWIRKTYD